MRLFRVALGTARISFVIALAGFAEATAADPASTTEANSASMTAAQVLDCVVANAPSRTAHQEFKLLVHDRGGGVQTLQAELHWKRDEEKLTKILVRLSAPADLRGSSYLLLERPEQNDMFAYLPALKLVRRITGRHSAGSVFGSDFSYEDMQRLYNVTSTGTSKRLADATVDGRASYVIETVPATADESAYRKTLSYVDQTTCVALKTEFFENDDAPRKTLLADVASLEQVDSVWLPRKVRIEDVRTATHTDLIVEKIEFDVEIEDRIFTRSSLERKGR